MRKFEKILEEIEKSGITSVELFGRKVPFVAESEVERIILKHIHDEPDLITEMCPHCGEETGILWDVEKDGYQVYCPNCGKPMMLCSMCDARDGAICDWTEKGCKHSDDRYCMNSGWVPVEDGLPENSDDVLATTFNGDVICAWYNMASKKWYGYEEEDIIAWRPLPEPYRPERRAQNGNQ